LAIGEPRPAVGIDINEGLLVRYDETQKEIIGVTMIGLRAKM